MKHTGFALCLIAGIACYVTGLGGSNLAFILMGVGALGLVVSAFARK